MSIQGNVLNSRHLIFAQNSTNNINEPEKDIALSQQLNQAKEMGYSDAEIFSALEIANMTQKNKVCSQNKVISTSIFNWDLNFLSKF